MRTEKSKNAAVSPAFFILLAVLNANGVLFAQDDSLDRPTEVELPFELKTEIETDSDVDYFRFTAPAGMKIRVRASGRFWHDPSIIVYGPNSTEILDRNDNGGPGRDALLEFFVRGGQEYIVAATNDRAGPCRVKIDSQDLVMYYRDSTPENTYAPSVVTHLWEIGNHFGTERVFSNLKRNVELKSYCLDPITLERLEMSYGAENFREELDVDLPVVFEDSLPIKINFLPQSRGRLYGDLTIDYRAGSKRFFDQTSFSGFGVYGWRASILNSTYHGNSRFVDGEFRNRDNAAKYHQFRVPPGGGTYRAMVYAFPDKADRYHLSGTVFSKGFHSAQVAARLGKGFLYITEPLASGRNLYVKAEIRPQDIEAPIGFPGGNVRLPAGYKLYINYIRQ